MNRKAWESCIALALSMKSITVLVVLFFSMKSSVLRTNYLVEPSRSLAKVKTNLNPGKSDLL